MKTVLEISFLTHAEQMVRVYSNFEGISLTCSETEGPEPRKSYLTYLDEADAKSLIDSLQTALTHQKEKK